MEACGAEERDGCRHVDLWNEPHHPLKTQNSYCGEQMLAVAFYIKLKIEGAACFFFTKKMTWIDFLQVYGGEAGILFSNFIVGLIIYRKLYRESI
jgi:hypothetical protein